VNKAIMQMDETTQQNAALVEEATSASQSMKEQAKELIRSVEVFKTVQAKGHLTTHVGPRETQPVTAKPTARVHEPKPMDKKPTEKHEPVGVAASNGKDRSANSGDFEEF
jgi:methyl-accepting chemotaxis protein